MSPTKTRKILIIYNQKKPGSLKILSRLTKKLSENKIQFQASESTYPKHIFDIIAKTNFSDITEVVGLGGDGTINEIVHALILKKEAKNIPVGNIPLGTGNDFIRVFGSIKQDFWMNKVVEGNTKKVDAIKLDLGTGTFYSVENSGWGLFWETVPYSRPFVWLGSICYTLGAICCFLLTKLRKAKITIEDQVLEDEEFWGVTICNVPFAAGGMELSPKADFNDGKVNLIILKKSPRWRLIWGFIKFNFKLHENDPYFKRVETTRFKIDLVIKDDHMHNDGEPREISQIYAEVQKSAFLFIC